ncbi:glycosyltransferase [Shewanella oncorhynchi]|uniref:glycosyltransferase n=1 Tax=Shewanella oncorhynchi TaxID=2726434 RepID=UPI003D796FE3
MSMINTLKMKVKKNKTFLNFYELCFQRTIINLFNSKSNKKVLFSYSTYHFNKKNYLSHSNYQESNVIAAIFDDMGYRVDIINNNRLTKLDLSSYDVVFGEGLPLYQAISLNNAPKTIYYGTGSHPFHCTEQSYKRLISFHHKYSFMAISSLRTSDTRWGLAASMADAVICIGNDVTKSTFTAHGANHVYTVDPTYHPRPDAKIIGHLKNFDECRKSMLWFGSYGLLHKGLDLAVEAFKNHPDWTLHICGYTPAEKDFMDTLALPSNTIVHGFINVFDEQFKALASQCGFVILPSCSEGTATAVITAVANGAMIPVVTKECGYDVGTSGYIIELSAENIERQLVELDKYESSKLKEVAISAQLSAINRYTTENFQTQVKINLANIINKRFQ